MFDTGREKKKLDVLEPGKGKRVDNLDGVVVDHLLNLKSFKNMFKKLVYH